jgi:hypothetical protein
MAFSGIEPVRGKICINDRYWDKSLFNYLGYNICYERGKDLNEKTLATPNISFWH